MATTFSRRSLGDLPFDFWAFWTGQGISTLGSSFTVFALPLLIFQLTGSAVNLSLSMAISYLPSVAMGLLVGAWVDRMNRKALMIILNALFAVSVASIPAAAFTGHLSIIWIYGVQLVNAIMRLFFTSASMAAIPSLVERDRLVAANGRIQASYSAMSVIGPILAGGLAAVVPLPALLLVDSASYLVGAGALLLVRRSFNLHTERPTAQQSVRTDVMEGLRFVLGHPVLRTISIMMALVNFFSMIVPAQLVFYAKTHVHAANTEVGVLFAANAVGVFILALLAGPLRRHWPFSRIALGLLEIQGVVTIVLAQVHIFWLALPLLALWQGLSTLFSINTTSLRQILTPNRLLGRVVMVANVFGSIAIPLGTLAGGYAIQQTGHIGWVFSAVGVAIFTIPVIFSFTALGRAEQYIPEEKIGHSRPSAVNLSEPPAGDSRVRLRAELVSLAWAAEAITREVGDLAEDDGHQVEQSLDRIRRSVDDVNRRWGAVEEYACHDLDAPADTERGQVDGGTVTGRSMT
jgi:MFS family permease